MKWFYAILHFCNTSSGIPTQFLADHIGISQKAAFRMGALIRIHLMTIDSTIPIGGLGKRVFVDENSISNVIDGTKGARKRLRILTVSDWRNFTVIPVEKGRFRNVKVALQQRIHPSSVLEFRESETLQKLIDHRGADSLGGFEFHLTKNKYATEYCAQSVMVIALKQFLIRNHTWISASRLRLYLAHFEFLYRRRHQGETVFHDAISAFPDVSDSAHAWLA